MKTQLGVTVTDRISGFTGIVTGRVEYISGCNQLLVTPKAGKDAAWFDEQRCKVDIRRAAIVLDNSGNPGHDKSAPVR